MAKTPTTRNPSRDSIQRDYLVRKLKRMQRGLSFFNARRVVLDELLAWVHNQTVRSKRPGGL